MDKLKELLSVLLLYRANFHNLHWNAKGHEFDNLHSNVTSSYYDKALDDADKVAEFITRLGDNPPNYKEVLDIIEHSGKDYLLINSSVLVNKEEAQVLINIMLKDICECICKCLKDDLIDEEIKNVGIKSSLESMLDEYDIQYRYINKRRLTK